MTEPPGRPGGCGRQGKRWWRRQPGLSESWGRWQLGSLVRGGGQASNVRLSPLSRPDDPRGSRDPENPPGWQCLQRSPQAWAGSAAPAGSGGPRAPLCEGRGRVPGSPWPRALSAPPPPGASRGRAASWSPPSPLPTPPPPPARLSSPGLALLPTPPAWASVPIGRALPSHPHPPRHFALSPPPPLTSSSSPLALLLARSLAGWALGFSALLPSSQISAHLPPRSSRSAASGCSFPPSGGSW